MEPVGMETSSWDGEEERAPTVELVCGACGYGIRVRRLPERCPMCHRSAWRPRRRPRLLTDLAPTPGGLRGGKA